MKKYIILICALLATIGMAAWAIGDGRHATDKTAKTAGIEPKQGDYGYIEFYEGYGGTQDVFCTTRITQRPFNVQFQMGARCNKNDEANSAKLVGTPASTVLRVYDNPNCETGDDYAIITALRAASPPITVHHFESNDPNSSDYMIRYYWQDGHLDGKVSCVQIYVPPAP